MRSGDLSAEHNQVDRSYVEPACDVAEVVGRLGCVAEVSEAGEGVVEDELALADQQHAPLCVVGCHVSAFLVLGLMGGQVGVQRAGAPSLPWDDAVVLDELAVERAVDRGAGEGEDVGGRFFG